MTDTKLIDSNVLIYAFDEDEGEKNKKARNLISDIIKNNKYISFSTQNLSEFITVSTKKIEKPISIDYAKKIVSLVLNLPHTRVLQIFDTTILKALDYTKEFSIHYWDALIVAVMYENDIYTIITENEKDFQKIPWIKVVNPFS